MDYSILDKKTISWINKMLETKTPRLEFFKFANQQFKYLDLPGLEAQRLFKMSIQTDENSDSIYEEIRNEIKEITLIYNLVENKNLIKKSSVTTFEKFELLYWISHLPVLSHNRKNGEELYIYNKSANEKWFSNHRLTSFGKLNDPFEIVALYNMLKDSSLCNVVNEILEDKNNGKILISCTTLLKDSNYFNVQYSQGSGNYASINKKQALSNFDGLYSRNKFYPIRGLVRYGKVGKNDYLSIVSRCATNPKIKKLIFYLYSLFVKNDVMHIEQEYRFILLQTKNYISCIDIATKLTHEHSPKKIYPLNDNELLAQKYYEENCSTSLGGRLLCGFDD